MNSSTTERMRQLDEDTMDLRSEHLPFTFKPVKACLHHRRKSRDGPLLSSPVTAPFALALTGGAETTGLAGMEATGLAGIDAGRGAEVMDDFVAPDFPPWPTVVQPAAAV